MKPVIEASGGVSDYSTGPGLAQGYLSTRSSVKNSPPQCASPQLGRLDSFFNSSVARITTNHALHKWGSKCIILLPYVNPPRALTRTLKPHAIDSRLRRLSREGSCYEKDRPGSRGRL